MSDPAATTVPATSSGTTAPSSTVSPDAGGRSGTLPPAKITIHANTFNSDCGWPVELKLDSAKGNWQEWDKHLHFLCDQRGFHPYLNGKLPCPDESIHPEAAGAWETSDVALRGFIFQHISDYDYELVSELPSANKIYESLCDRHQKQGPYAQIKVIRAILDAQTEHGTPLCQTFDEIAKLQSRYIKMGHLTDDQLLCVYMLNALRVNHPRMQMSLNDLLANPLTTSVDICKHLEQEDHTTVTGAPPDAALAAASSKPARPLCINCQKPGHCTEFCITPGGQMAGKTIEEARTARDAARAKQ